MNSNLKVKGTKSLFFKNGRKQESLAYLHQYWQVLQKMIKKINNMVIDKYVFSMNC